MGLFIYIYKDNLGDCTNNGISSKKIKGLTITNINGPFKPCKDYPAAKLILQKFSFGNSVKIVAEKDINKHTMFGGNYGATSDSRFNEAIKKMLGHNFYGAIPIHDRIE
tara:strand:+ start:1524 stop:1850 length:327 start_codon:yes stop_codon:yes gene_type:complete